MCFSALEILIFHLWVTVFKNNQVELFIRKTAYIGVDIFFLLSVYSLASRKITDLKAYYLSRFKAVYFKFFVFTALASILSAWGIKRFVQILLGIELFKKGGGAFLWFLPAIVLVYLVFPFIQKFASKKPLLGGLITLAIWFITGLAISKLTSYKEIFIFWNRIPAMVTGFLLASYSDVLCSFFGRRKWLKAVTGILLLAFGTLLLYKFGFTTRLSVPIRDMFYVVALPSVLGLILLLDYIPENKVTILIGSATLELYAIQMIIGFTLAGDFYKLCRNALLTNILSLLSITLISLLASFLFKQFYRLFKKKQS